MRTYVTWTLVAAGAAVLIGSGTFRRAGGAAESPSEVGRYQTAVAGSRSGIQRRGFGFRLDTKTGKAWHVMVLYDGNTEGWTEIRETEGAAPEAGAAAGRYQISADLISDKSGTEAASAVRIDTVTGRTWFARALPPPVQWLPLKDPTPPPGR